MRSLDEIRANATDRVAFSNTSSFEVWAENWCGRCVHDGLWGIGPQDAECPILTVSMTGHTPAEWLTTDSSDRYPCIEFRGPDERGQAPAPLEPMPGADPRRTVRRGTHVRRRRRRSARADRTDLNRSLPLPIRDQKRSPMNIRTFRKKPVTLRAVQWTGDNEDELRQFTGGRFGFVDAEQVGKVYDALHDSWICVHKGRWVVEGVKGEFYPLDPQVLAETYEELQ